MKQFMLDLNNCKTKNKAGLETLKKWNEFLKINDAECFVQYVNHNDKAHLNRGTFAKALDIAKAALRQNPDLKYFFPKLEEGLRSRGILAKLTEKSAAELGKEKPFDRKGIQKAREENQISTLQQQVIELKAENEALRGKLGRFSELSDTFNELSEM